MHPVCKEYLYCRHRIRAYRRGNCVRRICRGNCGERDCNCRIRACRQGNCGERDCNCRMWVNHWGNFPEKDSWVLLQHLIQMYGIFSCVSFLKGCLPWYVYFSILLTTPLFFILVAINRWPTDSSHAWWKWWMTFEQSVVGFCKEVEFNSCSFIYFSEPNHDSTLTSPCHL